MKIHVLVHYICECISLLFLISLSFKGLELKSGVSRTGSEVHIYKVPFSAKIRYSKRERESERYKEVVMPLFTYRCLKILEFPR